MAYLDLMLSGHCAQCSGRRFAAAAVRPTRGWVLICNHPN
jgi:hypothetical protein